MTYIPDFQVRLCVSNRRESSGFRGEYHRHPFYELGFVLEGVCTWQLYGRHSVEAKTGQVVLIPPQCRHRERSNSRVQLGWLGFESATPIESELFFQPISLGIDFEWARELLSRIGEELAPGRLYADELIPLTLRSVLLVVRRAAHAEPLTSLETEINTHQKRVATSVAAYLERNAIHPLTLAEVARYHNLSAQHLSVIFQRCYGMTPTSFRLRHRIEHAKNLLRTRPDLGLKNIATACGFTDATHFGKEFRRWTGLTPRQAR